MCDLEQFLCSSKGTRVSDYWGNNSVAIMSSQVTPILTYYTSESHQRSMLIDKYTYHSFCLPISFGLKACLDKNTTWVKPVFFHQSNTKNNFLCKNALVCVFLFPQRKVF
uniref:Uncharacterized protein n=1 Tax=Cyanistes caeruleus TaxID=156563 RepID=A0A8C0VNL7_CYACU